MPLKLRIFALTVTALGVVAVAASLQWHVDEGGQLHNWVSAGAVVVLITVFQIRPISYNRRNGGHAIHPTEGFAIALMHVAPDPLVPLLVVAGTLTAQLYFRQHPIKIGFNVGVSGLSAAAGTWMYVTYGRAVFDETSLAAIGAVAATVLVMMLVEWTLMIGLFLVKEGRAFDAGVRQVYLPASLVAVGSAIILNYAFVRGPAVQAGAVVVIAIFHLLFSSNALAVEMRGRAEELTALGFLLTDTSRFEANLERFVAAVTEMVRARQGVLWLEREQVAIVHRSGEGTSRTAVVADQLGPLPVAALREASKVTTPQEFGAGDRHPLAVGLSGPATRTVVGVTYGDTPYGALVFDDWLPASTKVQRRADLRLLSDIARTVAGSCATETLLGQARATSERLAAYEQAAELVAAESGVPFVAFDEFGTVTVWNNAMAARTQVAVEEALGRTWHEQLRPLSTSDATAMNDVLQGHTRRVVLRSTRTGTQLACVARRCGGETLLLEPVGTLVSVSALPGRVVSGGQ